MTTLSYMATPRSSVFYICLFCFMWWLIGPYALLWAFASVTGFMVAHRLRARTEHLHFTNPGATIYKSEPPWWQRAWYQPHGTWRHYEHHHYIR